MSLSDPGNQGEIVASGRRRSGRRWRGLWLLVGAGLFLLGLLAGLYLFFPAETLKQRIIQETEARINARVQVEQLSLYPLLTLRAEGVGVDLDKLPEPLKIDSLDISPQWATLLSDPGAALKARAMNGTLSGVVTRSGTLSAEAAGLRFDLPLLEPIPCTISLTVSAAKIATDTVLGSDTATSLMLQISNARILGLAGLDADNQGIAVGEITLQAEGRGRNLEIKTLKAAGGVLDLTGQGTLLIGRTAATSRIRLDLQAKPGPNANPNITTLLQMSGEADDEGLYALRLTGTLTKPNLKAGE